MHHAVESKLAVITGASSGIGKRFAYALAERGYSVVLIARRIKHLKKISLDIRNKYKANIYIFKADLVSHLQRKQLIQKIKKQFSSIDIFINNAGYGAFGDALHVGVDNSIRLIELHNSATTELTLSLLPQVLKSTDRGIIHVSSVAAFHPSVHAAVYAATKAYIYSFSMALSSEYENKANILTLCPGITETDFWTTSGVNPPKILQHSPEKVIHTALKALGNKKLVVIGLENKIRISLQKILSDEFVLALTKTINMLLSWNTKK